MIHHSRFDIYKIAFPANFFLPKMFVFYSHFHNLAMIYRLIWVFAAQFALLHIYWALECCVAAWNRGSFKFFCISARAPNFSFSSARSIFLFYLHWFDPYLLFCLKRSFFLDSCHIHSFSFSSSWCFSVTRNYIWRSFISDMTWIWAVFLLFLAAKITAFSIWWFPKSIIYRHHFGELRSFAVALSLSQKMVLVITKLWWWLIVFFS